MNPTAWKNKEEKRQLSDLEEKRYNQPNMLVTTSIYIMIKCKLKPETWIVKHF